MCVSLSEQYITSNIQIHPHLPPCHSELYKSILEHFFHGAVSYSQQMCAPISPCVLQKYKV